MRVTSVAALLLGLLGSPAHNMAPPDTTAQSWWESASHVELNTVSESDSRDRLEQITENLAAYSAVTDTDVSEAARANLLSVLQRLDAAVPERGRPVSGRSSSPRQKV